MLTVSRIDPRKGLRVLPEAVRLLADAGIGAELDIIGGPVGAPGEDERRAILAAANTCRVADRVSLLGPVPLERLLPAYRDYDIFVLPTLPGEGIPRVLLEAMAAGLPVVATRVSGIPSLVTHETNGLLLESSSASAVANAVTRVVRDGALRRRLISHGYHTARAHTLEAQAARMMRVVSARKRQVCFVLPSLNGGGAERAAVQILNALDETRWNRSMYLFQREGPYLAEVDPAIVLTSGAGGSRLRRWLDLREFLKRTRPQLVVSFLSSFAVLTAAGAGGVGAAVAFNQQRPWPGFLRDADYNWRGLWHRRAFWVFARALYRLAEA